MRKRKIGIIVSVKMDKTAVVRVKSHKKHKLYGKAVTSHKKFIVHDEGNGAVLGSEVVIEECRPLSKFKCWTLVNGFGKSL